MTLRLAILIALLVFAGAVAAGAQTQYGVFSDFFPQKTTNEASLEEMKVAGEQPEAAPFVQSADQKSAKYGSPSTYRRVDKGYFNVGELVFGEDGAGNMKFELSVAGGAHSGIIEGYATRSGARATSTSVFDEDDTTCLVRMKFEDNNTVEITADDTCSGYAGMGAWFDGIYVKDAADPKPNMDWVIKDPKVRTAFEALVGADFERFALTANYSTQIETTRANVEAYSLWVRGIALFRNSVVMFSVDGRIWAAVFAEETYGENNEIWYYTNVESDKHRLPIEIETWADASYESYSVVYKNG